MPQNIQKIVYLFGAGATHSELTNLDENLIEEKYGLLMRHVSARVIEKARHKKPYLKGLEMVSSTKGSLNIELLISLIESSRVEDWEQKSRILKGLVKEDINRVLTTQRKSRFYLHKALVELHEHRKVKAKEKLIGLISLNYDDVLDRAYEKYYGPPNYCFSLKDNPPISGKVPLLKLHGSFNWTGIRVNGRIRTMEIIPLGANKNYIHTPYNFIWNRAMEVVTECDILRVIGCSLSQNDLHLVDLLFKAHLEKGKPFIIEIIGSDTTGQRIRENYGFFPEIKTLTEIGSPSAGYANQVPLVAEAKPENVFATWLRYKANSLLLKNEIKAATYLKHFTTI